MYLLMTLGMYQRNNPYMAILDWDSKQIVDTFTYYSVEFPNIQSSSFRGGTFYDGLFYVGTFNEILAVDIKTWAIHRKLSCPTFNDIHDVFVCEDGIWVCLTGLECVEHYSHNFDLLGRFNMSEIGTWERYDNEIDHRLREIDKRTTPRLQHICNIVKVDDEIMVTRGKSKTVTNLDRHEIISGLPGQPHDGFVSDGEFYLTTVNGFVESFLVKTWQRVHSYNLNKFYKTSEALGWCRGLALNPSGDSIFVGFTKFRPTTALDYIRWVQRKPHELGTRIVQYSRGLDKLIDVYMLKSESSTSILLYGIYPLTD